MSRSIQSTANLRVPTAREFDRPNTTQAVQGRGKHCETTDLIHSGPSMSSTRGTWSDAPYTSSLISHCLTFARSCSESCK